MMLDPVAWKSRRAVLRWESLFFSNLDGAYQGIILGGSKCKVKFTLRGGRNVVEDLYNGAVTHATSFFENIEIFQQSSNVAIEIKNTAANPPPHLIRTNLGLCK